MQRTNRAGRARGWAVLLGSAVLASAHAHLMEDQQGTLNIVGARGYLVLSLPVSALSGVDDDRDGRLDAAELARHSAAIERDLRARVRVSDGGVAAPLDGVLLNLSPDEHHREVAATHVVLLAVAMFPKPPLRPELEVRVFGRSAAERSIRVVGTRRDAAGRMQEQVVRFTPEIPRHGFFAPAAATKAAPKPASRPPKH
ncbi:MAG: hypothetical protein ACK51K_21130 [Gammaproteobacteria bacterium]